MVISEAMIVLGRRPVLALFFALALVGCKQKKAAEEPGLPTVQGNAVTATDSRQLAPFTRIVIGGALDVTINVGKDGPLELHGDKNFFEHVPSPVVDGELTLKPNAVLKGTQSFQVTIATARLDRISAAVAAKVVVHGVRSDAFEASVGGGAHLTVDGSAGRLKLSSRSAARVDFTGFSASAAEVSAGDLSRVELGHLEKLDVTQSKVASVTYRGTPEVTKRTDKAALVAPQSP